MTNKVVKMSNTKQVDFGGLTLQLRLTGKDIMHIEDRLDESLMSLFMNSRGGVGLPSTKKLLIVLQGANQVSGVRDADIFKAFEKYLDNGHTTMDVLNIVQELMDESGFFGKEDESKEDEKSKEDEMTFDQTPTEDFEV